MFTVEYAKDPRFVSSDGQDIDLIVKFAELTEEFPFTASANDQMSYGRELHARAASGEFGPVAPYVPTANPTPQGQPAVQGAQTL